MSSTTNNNTSSTGGSVMDKMKAKVDGFMHKDGHHDTTVHEKVAPGVVHEQVKPTRHEEVVTAVDKEVHQDHHHTTIQPVADRQVLPEKHTGQMAAVEHRKFEHGDHSATADRVAAEQSQFRDQRVVGETKHTHSVGAAVAGEHHHHHVHETIQPIVERETIQPEVVHTTVPVHEVHHNAPQHHTITQAPVVSMSDFKQQGGILSGRSERTDAFEGEPATVGGKVASHLSGRNTATVGATK